MGRFTRYTDKRFRPRDSRWPRLVVVVRPERRHRGQETR